MSKGMLFVYVIATAATVHMACSKVIEGTDMSWWWVFSPLIVSTIPWIMAIITVITLWMILPYTDEEGR